MYILVVQVPMHVLCYVYLRSRPAGSSELVYDSRTSVILPSEYVHMYSTYILYKSCMYSMIRIP